MDARKFLNDLGHGEAERVAVAAGTTLEYFKQLAYRARKPSVKLAKRLIAADSRLTLLELIDPPERPQRQPRPAPAEQEAV